MSDKMEGNALQKAFSEGIQALQSGKLNVAKLAFTNLIARSPDHAGALNGLGLVAARQGALKAAEDHWLKAVDAAPDFAAPHANLGNLKRNLDPVAAIHHYQKAIACDLKDPQPVFGLASLLEISGRYHEAQLLGAQAYDRFPDHAGFICLKAKTMLAEGDAEGAWRLTGSVKPLDKIPPRLAQMVAYTRVSIADALDNPQAALKASAQGAQILKQLFPQALQDADIYMTDLASLTAHFSRKPLYHPQETVGEGLIFLCGFPESGSTAIAHVIAEHPAVSFRGDSLVLSQCQRAAFGSPAVPRNLSSEEIQDLRRQFLAGFSQMEEGRKIRVDHLPLNVSLLGFAAELFPAARFVVTTRDAASACLAASMKSYELTSASANLLSFSSAARVYEKIHESWTVLYPHIKDRCLEISYDSIQSDAAATLASLLSFMGLESTASPDAVEALAKWPGPVTGDWKRYEKYLPKEALDRLSRCQGHMRLQDDPDISYE